MDDNQVSRLGLRAMIDMLGGYSHDREKAVDVHQRAVGKVIESLVLSKDSDAPPHGGHTTNSLHVGFSDGTKIVIWDDGQDCCESRYMTTDDDLQAFIGAEFTGIEIRTAWKSEKSKWDDVHDIQFMLVNTSKGTFTMESHNEHNGYYGGFAVRIAEE